jgi:hypothetical protein
MEQVVVPVIADHLVKPFADEHVLLIPIGTGD